MIFIHHPGGPAAGFRAKRSYNEVADRELVGQTGGRWGVALQLAGVAQDSATVGLKHPKVSFPIPRTRTSDRFC